MRPSHVVTARSALRARRANGDRTNENRHGHHQAIQARRGPRRPDRDRGARHDRHRGQGIRASKGAHRNLSRHRIRGELPAEAQDRGRSRYPTRSTRSSKPSPARPRPARSATARSSSSASNPPCASAPARPTPPPSNPILKSSDRSSTCRSSFRTGPGLTAALAAAATLAATSAFAEPTVNKGDNAWMLTSTVLVLLMTIPGLALFYGGLVRAKNMLSVLMHVFYTVCIVALIWVIYGYSLDLHRRLALYRRLLQGVPRGRHDRIRRPRPSRSAPTSARSSTSVFQMTFARSRRR